MRNDSFTEWGTTHIKKQRKEKGVLDYLRDIFKPEQHYVLIIIFTFIIKSI